jgi:hypothetical protein
VNSQGDLAGSIPGDATRSPNCYTLIKLPLHPQFTDNFKFTFFITKQPSIFKIIQATYELLIIALHSLSRPRPPAGRIFTLSFVFSSIVNRLLGFDSFCTKKPPNAISNTYCYHKMECRVDVDRLKTWLRYVTLRTTRKFRERLHKLMAGT